MNERFDNETQCELSYELLYLLKWLVEHEGPILKKLVQRAVAQGLTLHRPDNDSALTATLDAQAQYSIVELLDMLDEFLQQAVEQENMRQAQVQNLIPAISKVDATVYDTNAMKDSIDKTTTQMRMHPEKNARELLMKELLKNWKPHKEVTSN